MKVAETENKTGKSGVTPKGRDLVIVESPAKAKTISKILGRKYSVMASVGHIRDLEKKGSGNKAFGVDIEKGYEPRYVVIPRKRKTVEELKTATRKANKIYLAPDPDREGEAIAWHLKEALELDDEKAQRISYRSVTKGAVQDAIANPRPIDMNLVGAQKSRRVLDRIVGFSLSPFLWKKVAKNLSAGRVQSVAVRLIVEKEREIAAFRPEEFWKVEAWLQNKASSPHSILARLVSWKGEKFVLGGSFSSSGKMAMDVKKQLEAAEFRAADVKNRETASRPLPPFITSTLQQSASSQLRYSARRTMMVAQKLYEGVQVAGEPMGLITYMRTDSFRVDPQFIRETRNWIEENYQGYLPDKPRLYVKKSKSTVKAQDAHEAIRPTDVKRSPREMKPYLTPEQYKLYEMIWCRTVASQMKDARYNVTTIVIEAAEGQLEAKGRITLFDGYTVLTSDTAKSRDEDYQQLPIIKTGEILLPLSPEQLANLGKGIDTDSHIQATRNFTTPPPRYTEASLVRSLEKEGIGRPSTYASIVQTIRDRGYVRLEKRVFYANELGMAVNDILQKEFSRIMDYKFTAEMESSLDAVEDGKIDWHKLIDDFYRPFEERVRKAIEDSEPLKGRPWKGSERCPVCGKELAIRYSRSGAFLGCSGYPECKGLMPLPGEGPDDGETSGEPVNCPICSKPMILKSSRYGKFYACSGYPDCKTTASLSPEGDPVFLPRIAMNCDECGTAMEVKSRRKGPAMVCPNGDCKRELPVVDGKVSKLPKANGAKCEKCGSPMIVRIARRGPFLACTGFPKCRNAKSLEADEKTEDRKEAVSLV